MSLQDVYVAGVPFDLAIRADILSPLPSLSIDIHLQRHPALWTMFTDMLNSDGLVYMCECVCPFKHISICIYSVNILF